MIVCAIYPLSMYSEMSQIHCLIGVIIIVLLFCGNICLHCLLCESFSFKALNSRKFKDPSEKDSEIERIQSSYRQKLVSVLKLHHKIFVLITTSL